jgi:hypothetical protein
MTETALSDVTYNSCVLTEVLLDDGLVCLVVAVVVAALVVVEVEVLVVCVLVVVLTTPTVIGNA